MVSSYRWMPLREEDRSEPGPPAQGRRVLVKCYSYDRGPWVQMTQQEARPFVERWEKRQRVKMIENCREMLAVAKNHRERRWVEKRLARLEQAD
jgi:hypothetical protein